MHDYTRNFRAILKQHKWRVKEELKIESLLFKK